MSAFNPHRLLLARLYLLPTEEGGRKGFIGSNHRPHWNIGNTGEGETELNDGFVFLEDRERLHPGEECVVRIEPLVSARWAHVAPGMRMAMHEGSSVKGFATVLEAIEVAW